MKIRSFIKILVFGIWSIQPDVVWCWGIDAHRIIAEIAQINLKPEVQQRIRNEFNIVFLSDVANWADQIKGERHQRNWHFTNIALGALNYEKNRDCRHQACVTEKIFHFVSILKSERGAKNLQTEAIKYLVHFIGDVHQPLHMGNAHDQGGNEIKVWFQGEKTNLHALWDYGLIFRKDKSLLQYARQLNCLKNETRPFGEDPPPVIQWTNESRLLALEVAYPIQFDEKRKLALVYIERSRKTIDFRMCQAGLRLAHLLNNLLDLGQ